MNLVMTCIVLSVLSVLFGFCSLFFAVMAYAKVIGMEKSTHRIQWMPMDYGNGDTSGQVSGEDDGMPRVSKIVDDFRKHVYPDMESEQV